MKSTVGKAVTLSDNGTGVTLTMYGDSGGVGVRSDSNSYSLTVSAPLALYASQQWQVYGGQPLNIAGPVNLGVNTLTLSGTGGGNTAFNANSAISGDGGLIVNRASRLITLAGVNTYTGTTTITAGTLQFAKPASLYNAFTDNWDPAHLTVASAATLALNVGGASDFTSGDLDTLLDSTHLGDSTTTTGLTSGALLGLSTANASFTYSTAIANPNGNTLGLTKLGANTLTLNGQNTYTGTTTISSGTLQIGDGTNAIATAGTGALAVGGNTLLLNLNGPATLGNSTITMANSGTIRNVGSGKVTINNAPDTTFGSGNVTTVDGGSAGIVLANTLTNASLGWWNGTSGGNGIAGNVTLNASTSVATIYCFTPSTTAHVTSSGAFWYIGAPLAANALNLDIASSVTVSLGSSQSNAVNSYYNNLSGDGSFTFNGGASQAAYIVGSSTLGGTLTANRPVSFGNGGATGTAGATRIASTANGSITFNSTTDNIYSGLMSGAGGLVKSAANTLTLSNTNTYTGATTISGGTLRVTSLADGLSNSNIGASSNSAANLRLGGGTLQYTGTGADINRLFSILPGGGTIDASGASNAALRFNNTGANFVTEPASRTGTTVATSKIITGLSSTADLYVGMAVAGSTIPLGATIASIDSLTQITLTASANNTAGSPSVSFGYGARTLTLTGTSTGANTIAGILEDGATVGGTAGTLSVAKSGAGVFILSGANSYTGTTTVTIGTLKAGATNALSAYSDITVSGGTLDVSGYAQTIKSLSLTGGYLDLGIGKLLTSNNLSTLGGTINVSGTPTGSLTQLIACASGISGSFTPGTIPNGYALEYNSTNTALNLVSLGPPTFAWVGTSGDNTWATGANWSSTAPTGGPNAAGTVLTFGNTGSQPTVDLGAADKTVGAINFSGQVAATLQSNPDSEVLSLKNAGGSTITVNHVTGMDLHTDTISVPLELNNDLSIKVADSGDGLVIDRNIGQYGGSFGLALAADNAGTVTLGGTNSYAGGTTVTGGTLVISSAGALPAGKSLSIGSGGTLILGGGMALGQATAAEPVPEPGTLALLAIASLAGAMIWRSNRD